MRVLIVHNDKREDANKAVGELCGWLADNGVEYVIAADCDGAPPDTADASGEGAHGYGLAIAVGGDGTILRCARMVGFSEIPILGYDFGTLGFLAGVSADNILDTIEDVLKRQLVVQHRAALLVVTEYADGTVERCFALNEVAVTHGGSGRIVDFDVCIDDIHVAHLRGDGMIVSTSTGSTAYALSAGGPLVAPGHKGLVVTPLAPHTISARAIVTGPDDVVELSPSMVSGEPTAVFIDGYTTGCTAAPVKVTVERGPGEVVLLGKHAKRFYSDIARTFFNGTGRAGDLGYGDWKARAGQR